jgi:Arc/MetJ family transcription regulator
MSRCYSNGMARTTFRLDEDLLAEAKAFAARQHRSMNSVMEDALRRMLATAHELEDRPPVELITYGSGGPHPEVDLSPAGIKQLLEDEDIEHFLEVTADVARRHQRADIRAPARRRTAR